MALRTVSLDELIIDDESAVKHMALYDRLKQALRRSQHRFVIRLDTEAFLTPLIGQLRIGNQLLDEELR